MPPDSYLYSYINKTGNTVIDASQFQAAGRFSEGLAPVLSTNQRWGYLDKTGKMMLPPQFAQALGFSEGLAAVDLNGKWGFIDKSGEVVIEPKYELVNSFSEGMAVVVRGSSIPEHTQPPKIPSGATQVRLIISERRTLEVTSAKDSSAGMGAPHKEVLIINETGQTLLSLNMSEIQLSIYDGARFSEGLIDAQDCTTNKRGFIDKKGKFVIEPKYEEASPFSEGLARVSILEEREEKVGFIDHCGEFVISPKFNTDADFRNSSDFSEGLAGLTEGLRPTVTHEEKYSFIDRNGAIVLMTDFFSAFPFHDGLAAVYDVDKDKWGFINKSGKVELPIQYVAASNFSEGLAVVITLRK